MKNVIKYKDTYAAKGSPLALAIAESPAAAKKLYDETTERFDALYPSAKDDRFAMIAMGKNLVRKTKVTKGVADVYKISTPDGDFSAIYIEHGMGSHDSAWIRISVTGSHGNYGTFWSSVGKDYKKFLSCIDFDYAMKNLTNYKHREFNAEATFQKCKREILKSRRIGDLSKDDARHAFEVLEGVNDVTHRELFINELMQSDCAYFESCYEWLPVECYKPVCVGFWQDIWQPFLKELNGGE